MSAPTLIRRRQDGERREVRGVEVTVLPSHLSRPELCRLMGLARADAERLFSMCPRFRIPGGSTVYVRSADVMAALEELPGVAA